MCFVVVVVVCVWFIFVIFHQWLLPFLFYRQHSNDKWRFIPHSYKENPGHPALRVEAGGGSSRFWNSSSTPRSLDNLKPLSKRCAMLCQISPGVPHLAPQANCGPCAWANYCLAFPMTGCCMYVPLDSVKDFRLESVSSNTKCTLSLG